MQNSSFSPQFSVIWGSSAGTDTITYPIPSTTSTSGRAALGTGFTSTNMTPIAAGGIPPFGQDFNGVLKMLSTSVQNYEAGCVPTWSSSFATSINGYPKYSLVQYGGIYYVSSVDQNSTTPGSTGASWNTLFSGYLSGTYGVISDNGDKDGIGAHYDGSTGRISFVYSSGSGDLAWYSDVQTALEAVSTETSRAEAVEATLVSGTLGAIVASGDSYGTGLHYRGATGNASFLYTGGSFDLAKQSAVDAEKTRAEAAEATLISGTYGVIASNGDKNGTALHYDGDTSRPSFVYDGGSGTVAWYSDVTTEASARESADTTLASSISIEIARAKAAEADLVSGTLGVIASNGDKQGTGLHYRGATGNASFVYEGGSFDLASQSSLASEASARENADSSLSSAISSETARAKAAEADLVSGTLGVIAANGDQQGTGLHLNGLTGNASFTSEAGSFDLASQSSLTSEASSRQSADSSLASSISNETARAKAAEATLVSGTSGVIAANGDKDGKGLHLDGSTGNASFVYDGGSFDLASYSALTSMPTLYTGSTSLTVASGKSVAVIKLVGGGGSGCSVKGSSIAESTYGAGGAAGGYVHFWIAVSSGDTLSITVGAGAASPVNTVNGQTNGGDTIVTLNGTEIARASGGTGGVWNSVASCAGGTGGGATTQNGATPLDYSNGTDGGDGQTGAESISSVTGYGAPGVWGGGGRAGNGGGQAGTGFGAGGGGAYDTSYSDVFYGGGAGHDGCAVVEFK